ncbi:MAG: hypothetical protein ABSC19_11890 [Syntrophorhabdales bacterium]|jgi:hypothetical protein
MMKERIPVFINGSRVEVFRGMKVRHALIAYDFAIYKECREGRAEVRDDHGFALGLDGALTEGAAMHVTMDRGER